MLPPANPTMIGSYVLGPLIFHGTQGEVYEAKDSRTDRKVALKLLHGGRWSDAEIKTCAKLNHPNIVPIHEIGQHNGWHYIAMKLMTGSLAADGTRPPYFQDTDAAAALMAKVAGAVHYLHQQGILHRDLKPANILLDDVGEPYVADLGVAKNLDESDHGTIAGTRRYMSPEQLDGHTTVRSDIFSLGVILYELITGQLPFQASDVSALTREIKENTPKDPRKLNPSLHRDLARICLRCLEKAPEERYGSAEALKLALVRYLHGELPEGASRLQRTWRWCLRHSATAGLIAAAITFLVIMIPTTVGLAREHESTKRAQMMQTNTSSASMVAGAVLSQLVQLSEAVKFAANDPALAAAVESGDAARQQVLCESFYRGYGASNYSLKLAGDPPFDTWYILNQSGRLTAQAGKVDAAHIIGRDYSWRDYFKGPEKLAKSGLHSTYVSRVIKSELDGNHKFAISIPIYGSAGALIGVLVGAVATSAKLGSLAFDDRENIRALAGPRDIEYKQAAPSPYMILLHPDYTYGEADPLTNAHVQALETASRGALRLERPLQLPDPSLVTSSDDYRDPAAERHPWYEGRWIAGFAPVGNTGFVVIVQTPYDVLRFEAQFGGQLVIWVGLSAVPGVLLMLFAAWHQRRRRLAK
jgi:hypothetical protein